MDAATFQDSGHALKTLPSGAVSSRTLQHEPSSEVKFSSDEAILAYFGKRQQLKASSPIGVLSGLLVYANITLCRGISGSCLLLDLHAQY